MMISSTKDSYSISLNGENITNRLRDVKAPIGLDIGGLTPEELAVSIMSEIIMVRRGGQGKPLTMEDWYLERVQEKSERAITA